MAILQNREKTKKIDLTKWFNGEDAYVTIKFIQRDIWRYANRLTFKTAEAMFYTEIVNDKEYKRIQKEIESCKEKEKKVKLQKELDTLANNILTQKYADLGKEKLKETLEVEQEKNRILIDEGVDKNLHNFTDENGNKIILDYEILKNCEFFDYLIQEIIKFNSEFDLQERR